MAASIYYESLSPVRPSEYKLIRQVAQKAAKQRAWLSCEPVTFFPPTADGVLKGASKPNFESKHNAPADLPDGNASDMLDVLCELSKSYGIDWMFVLEAGPPSGYVRAGVADQALVEEVRQLSEIANILAGQSTGARA